jgi:phenylpropionate dioxygenase-like ring-hydroxylating dioxygenase large terminal subunit
MGDVTRPRGPARRELAGADPMPDRCHPVGRLADGGEQRLPGGAPALWRDEDGTVRCCRDLCVHRGTAVSRTFDGRCTAIAHLAPGATVPVSANAVTFACEERYGLVWVCLGKPTADIPQFPEWGATGYRPAACPAYTWHSSAARMLENCTDLGHLGRLHGGLLGSSDDLTMGYHDAGHSRVLFFAVQPINADYVACQEVLAEQDRIVVESQHPAEVPLDPGDESHLKFDRVAVGHRKALVAHGLPA